MRKDIEHFSLNTGRWRNDVGRRLADLEIVLGTHRREVQVKMRQLAFSRLPKDKEKSSNNLEEVIACTTRRMGVQVKRSQSNP